MKINKLTSVLVALGVVSLASVASAQNTVYITGSTAFRPAAYQAIYNLFSPAPSVAAFSAANATDPSGASQMQFTGNIGGTAYVITANWSGSEGGIADLVSGGNENFLPVGTAPGTNTTAYAGGTTAHTVDFAFADNLQSFSKNPSPALTGKEIGVIPFVWVKNNNTVANPADWARIVNVSDAEVRADLKVGGILAAQFTGNVNDTTNYVYVAGRDNNSGTRVNTFADIGYGIKTLANQVLIGGANGAPTLTATTSGQASGGTVAKSLGFSGSIASNDPINGQTGWYAIGYLGMYDADTALGLGAVLLSYDGVTESTAAIQNGQYSFWGNEYFYEASTLDAGASTVFGLLTPAAFGAAVDGIHTISLTSMNATRNGPTSDPLHN